MADETLSVKIDGDTTGLEAAAGKAEKALGGIGKAAEDSGKRAEGGFSKAQAALTTLASTYMAAERVAQQFRSAFDAIAESAGRAESIRRVARDFNIGTDALQAWRMAAQAGGSSSNALDKALANLNKNIEEAVQGSESARSAFANLGLDVATLKAVGLESATKMVSDAMATATDRAAAMAAGAEIFGRDWRNLTDVLGQGSKSLDAVTESAKAAGKTISEMDLKKLADLDDALDEAALAAQRMIDAFAIGIGPSLENIAKGMENLSKKSGDAERAGRGVGVALEGAAWTAGKAWNLATAAVNVGEMAVSALAVTAGATADAVTTLTTGEQHLVRETRTMQEWFKTAAAQMRDTSIEFFIGKEAASAYASKAEQIARTNAVLAEALKKAREETEAKAKADRDAASATANAEYSERMRAIGIRDSSEEIVKQWQFEAAERVRILEESNVSAINAWSKFGVDYAKIDGAIHSASLAGPRAVLSAWQQAWATLAIMQKGAAINQKKEDDLSVARYNAIIAQKAVMDKQATSEQIKLDEEYFNSFKYQQDQMQKIWESGMAGKLEVAQYTTQGLSSMFGNLANAMDKHSRKGFETWKAMATAQGIVDAISSAIASYKSLAGIPYVGPYLGAAAAAAALAAGYANVRKIQGTKFGDKAGAGGSGYENIGGGRASSAQAEGGGSSNAGGGPGETGARMVTNQYNITLRGQSFGRDQVRGLLAEIQAAQADTGNIYNVATSAGA